MLGRQERWQEDLFVAGPLRDLIPEDHILRRVDAILDLSWLRDDVRDCYSASQGRSSIDPEWAVRLMLAGLFQNITHDRALMREAQVNLAMRWFAGYRLTDKLPDHSSLTRIRQRWGPERFRRIFLKSVEACGKAGLIDGQTVHVDATLIRADVSWESLTQRHVEQVLAEHPPDELPPTKRGRPPKKSPKPQKYSPTDPDATMSTSCKQYRMEPCYKQHTAVDDRAGVVVDVSLTTGQVNEGGQLSQQIDRVQANTGRRIKTLTADGGYAHPVNYALAESREIDAIIPPQTQVKHPKRIPARRFKYDARQQTVRCPAGKFLRPSTVQQNGQVYRAGAADCRGCALRQRCISPSSSSRVVLIVHHHESLLRARRRRLRWGPYEQTLYARHRWRVEGVHGEAKTRHGLRRATRRGLANVAIQSYMTAAAMNLKRLAASPCAVRPIIRTIESRITHHNRFGTVTHATVIPAKIVQRPAA